MWKQIIHFRGLGMMMIGFRHAITGTFGAGVRRYPTAMQWLKRFGLWQEQRSVNTHKPPVLQLQLQFLGSTYLC